MMPASKSIRKSITELLGLVEEQRDSIVEAHSVCNATGKPIPGTLRETVRPAVRYYDNVIRRARAALAKAGGDAE